MFQQDAHEFLNYLLNTCADILKSEIKEDKLSSHIINTENSDSINNMNNRKFLSGLSVHFNTMPITSYNSNKNKAKNTLEDSSYTNGSNNNFISNSNRSSNRSIQNNHNNSEYLSNESFLSSENNNKLYNNNQDTWIHELFQGILVNETKCLNCESVSSKDENFLDLSVDVEQNTSISHCLQEFSSMEMLCGECKYYCENCLSKQEAEKR